MVAACLTCRLIASTAARRSTARRPGPTPPVPAPAAVTALGGGTGLTLRVGSAEMPPGPQVAVQQFLARQLVSERHHPRDVPCSCDATVITLLSAENGLDPTSDDMSVEVERDGPCRARRSLRCPTARDVMPRAIRDHRGAGQVRWGLAPGPVRRDLQRDDTAQRTAPRFE